MTEPSTESKTASWQPLSRIDRRVVGVLVEKAKTTPNQYPLSLNALTNGCNQTSNRSPQMTLEEHQVEDALVRLRAMGAVGEVQGGSRVAKFRHYLKDWLDVTGPELAVMAELLLRGDQTVGELRARANRMTNNDIPDIGTLRPVVQSLMAKGLVIPLTPSGRGQVVTHNLYNEDELAKLKEKHNTPAGLTPDLGDAAETGTDSAGGDFYYDDPPTPQPASPTVPQNSASATVADSPATASRSGEADQASLEALRSEIAALKNDLAGLKKDVEDLWANLK